MPNARTHMGTVWRGFNSLSKLYLIPLKNQKILIQRSPKYSENRDESNSGSHNNPQKKFLRNLLCYQRLTIFHDEICYIFEFWYIHLDKVLISEYTSIDMDRVSHLSNFCHSSLHFFWKSSNLGKSLDQRMKICLIWIKSYFLFMMCDDLMIRRYTIYLFSVCILHCFESFISITEALCYIKEHRLYNTSYMDEYIFFNTK